MNDSVGFTSWIFGCDEDNRIMSSAKFNYSQTTKILYNFLKSVHYID